MIEIGLVIEEKWLKKILSGEKTWEIRPQRVSRRGRIALCQKKGPIVGTAVVGEPVEITVADSDRFFAKHRVPMPEMLAYAKGREKVFAYPLSQVVRLVPPIKYQHPGGGSWVKLSAGNVEEYRRLTGG